MIKSACLPKGSWLTAMTYSFPKIFRVYLEIPESEQPISKGDFNAAQRAKWDWYSSVVICPLPTSSISGSFHPPGPEYLDKLTCLSRIEVKDFQDPSISPVVLHELPTGAAQIQGVYCPHWHIEKKIDLPVLLRASLIGG